MTRKGDSGSVDDPRVILVTAPDRDTAHELARTLVGERLVACANLLPGVRSVYRWEGAVEEADEVLLLLKTRADRVDTLRRRVVSIHPYDVPEFVVLPVEGGLDRYLDWIRTESSPE
ncbi:divalent-cation tolerance protein CutA [Gaopeijia maritima]|uniref:Divalent-cation tolerance protein CutA n=1 Tax=Gaopeijia maritima TaxID=3119007 RepID=A0ABU9EAU0_9BACT